MKRTKKVLKVIVISIVIVGLIAMYVFSGFTAPAPAPTPTTSTPERNYYPQTISNEEVSAEEEVPSSGFHGPEEGSEPSVRGPIAFPPSGQEQ